MPKAIDFGKPPVTDSTKLCKASWEKRLPRGGLLFEISALPMVHRDTFKKPIRCIKKMEALARMVVPPLLNANRKSGVHFSAPPVRRNVEKVSRSLRPVEAFARMHLHLGHW
jgi:hypothetical protein